MAPELQMTTNVHNSSRDFFNPREQARLHMVEQIMVLHGAEQCDPTRFRAQLMAMSYDDLSKAWRKDIEAIASQL